MYMKVTITQKIISKSLALGLLLNSFLVSCAGILSEDGRYETFEGNNITIDNVLEEKEIDLEIEGNTLVNLLDGGESVNIPAGSYVNFELIQNSSTNKKYTLIFTSDVDRVYGGFVTDRNTWAGSFGLSQGLKGINKILITATEPCTTFRLRHDTTNATLSNVTLLKGDWTNKEIPEYFEEMKSVGEIKPLEIISNNSDNSLSSSNVLNIEPLRGLPNGVKDRIIKKNGQLVVERNCGEVLLDGSSDENWASYMYNSKDNDNYVVFHYIDDNTLLSKQIWGSDSLESGLCDRFDVIGEELYYPSNMWEGIAQGYSSTSDKNQWVIKIKKSRLNSSSVDDFIKWLKNNPIKFIYELRTPIYETINTESLAQIFEGTTYISTNSRIPANLITTIDRTLNIAVEFIELAKTNPTVDNISKARLWINLLPESIKKDELQSNLSNIFNINELSSIEPKNLTCNTDIYFKPENMLSVTLSTNNITFEDYSGIDNLNMNNAFTITVNSSLPYELNASMPVEIYNSDKTNYLPREILNIKESSDTEYRIFNSLNSNITLKSNNPSGKDVKHNIDLMLSGGIIYKVDVYKATLKLEIKQQ